MIIPPRFAAAGDFFNGLAWPERSPSAAISIPYQFDECRDFSEGLAAVQARRGWGFIDATGKFVISPHS